MSTIAFFNLAFSAGGLLGLVVMLPAAMRSGEWKDGSFWVFCLFVLALTGSSIYLDLIALRCIGVSQ